MFIMLFEYGVILNGSQTVSRWWWMSSLFEYGVILDYNEFLYKIIRTSAFRRGSYYLFVAQRRGFEPPDESPPSHDFQSCSLNHSDISARTYAILQQFYGKSNLFYL